MNRQHPPCSACAKFTPGHCAGFDRPAHSNDAPCVLFVQQGSRAQRQDAKSGHERLAELQRRQETISRASAPTAVPIRRPT